VKNYLKQIHTPGILGGMGPHAHIILEEYLLEINAKKFHAIKDRDHPVWITISATDIPDRTESIQNNPEDCILKLIRYCQKLEHAGADFILIPCNTSHAFFPAVQTEISSPIFNLMEITSEYISKKFPEARNIGILATDGTIYTQLYQKSLVSRDLQPIDFINSPGLQSQVMDSIYSTNWGIKATGEKVSAKALDALKKAMDTLMSQDCDLIISGCTEISVANSYADLSRKYPIIDPIKIVAEAALKYIYGYIDEET
jgi:aspartate racemase